MLSWDFDILESWGIVELINAHGVDLIGRICRWTATKSLQIPYVLNDLSGGRD
jgi:hypothetical protein